jgi:hypothetical protein
VEQQQRQAYEYRRYLAARTALAQQRVMLLQQQRRQAQYRFQQQYWDHMRAQEARYAAQRYYDYERDPFFYTPAIYRYSYGGRSYQTNQYGANLLRQAVNYGYQQGLAAGRADRQDRWSANYRDSFAYQDANYGYNGYYVSQPDYNNYFRQGFQRGYDDGYYDRYQYGQYNNGSVSLLETVLSLLLNLQPLNS